MDFKQSDDFWNATSGNKFAFDDEVEGEIELDNDNESSIFHSTIEVSSTLPLRAVISPKNLELILGDANVSGSAVVEPVDETIRNLCRGQDCVLVGYKSQSDKLHLLDKAIETFDGNVILKVVLFLSKTMKQNILYRHLALRSVALQQYVNYLAKSNKLHDLELLYIASNNKSGLSNLFYLSTQNTSSNFIHKRLAQFHIEHLDFLIDDYEKSIFIAHKQFLDFKLMHNLYEETPAVVFAAMCQKNLESISAHNSDLQNCKNVLKISNFKSEWIMTNVVASNEKWQYLDEIFHKEKWFNIKGKKKYNVPTELLVYNLYKHAAPVSILEDFLKRMDDSEKALFLGKRYKCHTFVVDCLINKKDHIGFVEYKNRILSDPTIKETIPPDLFSDKPF